MAIPLSNARVGVFVDGQYISLNGGHGMRYDVLREFATRDGAEVVRMSVYLAWDEDRAGEDHGYRRGQDNFAATLRDFGYKVIRKKVRRFTDESGNRAASTKTDLAMAMDVLLQSENLERILLLTGDEDFADVVRVLQSRGCRVEVIGFDNVSQLIRSEADMFMSGYLIPNLLPVPQQDRDAWGKIGSRVRGVCYNHSGKGYGFLRYVREAAPGLWITDSRHPDSPYETVFFHDSQLPGNVAFHQLPSRELIFEFDLTESDRFENDLQAVSLRLVSGVGRGRAQQGQREGEQEDQWEEEDAEWEDDEEEAAADSQPAEADYEEGEEELEEEEVPDRP
ncbi:MAG TPA: NYN domain-containing protein [bacterium]|nr:NYN domain-containing protein [bacterium]